MVASISLLVITRLTAITTWDVIALCAWITLSPLEYPLFSQHITCSVPLAKEWELASMQLVIFVDNPRVKVLNTLSAMSCHSDSNKRHSIFS